MKWTTEQQQVIDLRDRNLLVSAAAGSGKTAVLVERIIQKIMDKNHPVDIDRLLIVTFTNAAAAEMRERIGAAIEKALEQEPENVHLQKQQTLLHNAQITTIHSFCLYVIRNYFHRIELDPDFRVAEEGELKLLKSDVLDGVLEEYYEKAQPEFLALSETIATGKTDEPLKEAILKLYEFAMSYPWVEQWLEDCKAPYQVKNFTEFEELPMAKELEAYLSELSNQWKYQMEKCRNISMEIDGPQMYTSLLEQEAAAMGQIASCSTYEQYYEAIRGFSFGRLPGARKFDGDPMKKDQVQKLRNEVKASIKKITEQFFFQAPEIMIEELEKNAPIVAMLVEVTLAFQKAFSEKKREKNMLDFNDLEHFALEILVDKETKEPSKTAVELQKNYEEIMIDEYQDSNYVQETILKAVSGEAQNRSNMFMVGDVKQSIYRFRMARPELFMEKYNTYTTTDSENQKIDLHMNFRSRPQVLETVNDVFYKIMKTDIGNITYDKQAALYTGAEFPEAEDGMFDTELLVVEPDGENQDIKERELEAKAVGNKIKQFLEHQLVTDKETGNLRKAKYSDMVILLRSLTGWSDTFVKILGEMGIPAKATTGTGYFSAMEVQTALNLLRVLDNPRQDIPMAAVLTSPIVGLTGEELAIIRTEFPDKKFYEAVLQYHETEAIQQTAFPIEKQEKLAYFLEIMEKYRWKISYTPIHELLYQILEETGYMAYVYALPGGEVKKANLEMLIEKAIAYENTSYRGLFHFIRYMEQLQKYDVDFALADTSEQENMVQIMSIHKSKGLEFPVVFVSGLGKMFNTQDIREKVVLHPQLGIGMDYLDVERRVKTPGITRQFLARKTGMENTGEELRVLYVAMTRAKEKLILTGTMKKAEEKISGMIPAVMEDGFLSFLTRLGTNTFFGFLLPAFLCYGEKYPITILKQQELEQQEQQQTVKETLSQLEVLTKLQQRDEIQAEQIEKRLSYQYPFEEEEDMKTKVSVSEIKHRALDRIMAEETMDTEHKNITEQEMEHYIPAFMEGIQEENQGAKRGTAMHRILECYDFTKESVELENQLEQMQAEKLVEAEMIELVNKKTLRTFLESTLAKRMQQAAKNGKLYREKPFVMGETAKDVLEHSESEEMVLIQGIIDVFFEEDGEMVLLDYKTDRVKTGQELAERYRAQIELYKCAIERATGKRVKEQLLYSFCLNQVVEL
ncbi:helicase-exonuclease AddAB subunit AddA [Roseburia sp. 499]|uniref:helicase-exonuclease AddAB subunit AddA n=1 Tax=Roseburia sp. 499 TaxID=1261634 RepID=UPI0009526B13|nr:helicase-exonuclease AddAB subunit AddA [Roseburia sp. 499]WVK68565.1 helicase-exonuclease AddAB subunit AddA [Roseburia sp. 499]